MALQNFFYDGQIRRFITQFIRMVSNFQVEFGRDRNGNRTLQRVPVIYGDSSRQVANIIKQGSENIMNAVPAMAVYVSDLKYDRERLQNPTYVGKLNVRERYFNPATGQYTTTEGDVMTVERLMPVPYKLQLKLDIWTSSTEQKLQILEQIKCLFNPALEIQSTDNYVDWTSITYAMLDDTTWSSRTVPIGTDNPIDVATMSFTIPIWISPPALIKKLGVIQKIVASVYDTTGSLDDAVFNDTTLLSRQYLTPLQYGVILLDSKLKLVRYNEPVIDEFGAQYVKQIKTDVSANNRVVLDDTTNIEPDMVVSGLNFRGGGTITSNVNTNTVNGINTQFTTALGVGSTLFYNAVQLGTVGNVVSDTQLTLTTRAYANVNNVGFNVFNPVNQRNCRVISVNGDVVFCSNLISGSAGDRIVFNAVTREIGPSEPWRDLINIYGNLRNGSSTITLELDDGNEVMGAVAYNPINDTELLWTPDLDTIPANTLPPVNAIVDPQSSRPLKDLQDLVPGTRYLLVNDYISPEGEQPIYNWVGVDDTPIEAYANDIIEYNGQHWVVSFDSRYVTAINYVTNMTTGTQYRWNGFAWAKSYEGYYRAGKWMLTI